MEFKQLTGRYSRLKQELADAYDARPWRDGHVDRLANDLASIERQLSNAPHAGSPLNESVRSVGQGD